jgi:acetyl esterase/lipase
VAERGYVVAFVEYRPSSVAGFPAQVRDVRTALRYLAAHAADFHIAPGPIALWGDSSGAHTAVLTALTSDDPYFSDEPIDAPAPEIYAVVDYYGPSDISRMNEEPSVQDHRAADSPEGLLIGGVDVLDNPELANQNVTFYKLAAADHGDPSFWKPATLDLVVDFLEQHRPRS